MIRRNVRSDTDNPEFAARLPAEILETRTGDDDRLGNEQETRRVIGGAEKFDEYPYYGTPQKPAARAIQSR